MIRFHPTIQDINPRLFTKWIHYQSLGSLNYFRALEESHCLDEKLGWKPSYITYEESNQVCGLAFAFVKTHSEGDFVYDHLFVDPFQNLTRKKYYPKLQMGIPFVPIEGSKFFVSENEIQKGKFLNLLKATINFEQISSIHMTLPNQDEYPILVESGFVPTHKTLCYWPNQTYSQFEDYLHSLKSKYRSQIIHERKHLQSQGFISSYATGNNLTNKDVDIFYDLFEATYVRKKWGKPLLNRDFFQRFISYSPERVVFFFIRDQKKVVASSCHFIEESLLCSRFWGSAADEHFLHFEVMFYLPIEFAIQQKIPSIEIGFETPHKVIRGYVPKQVQNFHFFPEGGEQWIPQRWEISPEKKIYR